MIPSLVFINKNTALLCAVVRVGVDIADVQHLEQ